MPISVSTIPEDPFIKNLVPKLLKRTTEVADYLL